MRVQAGGIAVLLGVTLFALGCGGGAEEGAEPAETQAELREGDATRGMEVYVDMGCWTCHVFSGAEGATPGEPNSIGPNLDDVAAMYDAEFIRDSITDPSAYIEKGASGSIGGDEEYGTPMPAFGPEANEPRKLGEQDLADLVAFIESSGS